MYIRNGLVLKILVILCCCSNFDLILGKFDLDYPLVFSDLFGRPNSHFGYSVTLMKSRNPDVKGWVFIGAPKSNSTDPSYRARNNQEPGAIWRCSLGRRRNETCEILNLDPISSQTGKQCNFRRCEDFPKSESKYSNWLGVSMSSSDNGGGKLVACGHRWTRGEGTLMNGICYYLKGLDINRYFEGRGETPVNLEKYSHRLIPFFEKGNGSNQYFKFDEGRSTSVKWAIGQVGMSSHIGKQGSGTELLLGAPGVYVWSGAVVRYQDGNPRSSVSSENRERKNRDGSYDFATYSISTRPHSERNTHWHDYFGYAVTSGKFDSTGQTLYASGSPRGGSYLNGEVIIFRIPLEGKKDEIYTLAGPQIADYFGSVLLAVDTNGDGLDELFVAAPLFSREVASASGIGFRQEKSKSSSAENLRVRELESRFRSGDQGVVYMYSGERQFKGETEGNKLFGDEEDSAGARFGSALSSLGDISGDGLNDIAIGAPFENEDKGAVYIFYGRKDGIPQLFQKIRPEDIYNPILGRVRMEGFGSSLSMGDDIDDNGVPDLAIGCYSSAQTVILRTRPIMEIMGEVTFSFGGNKNVVILPRGQRTFNIYSGIRLASKLGKNKESLKVTVTLTFDAKYNRFHIKPESKSIRPGRNPREWEYEDQITNTGVNFYGFEAILQKEHNDSDPNLPRFLVEQRVSFDDISSVPRPKGPRFYDILGNKQVSVSSSPGFDDFCSTCVGKGERRTNFALELSDEECIGAACVPKLRIKSSFRLTGRGDTSPIKTFVIGSFKEVLLEIIVKNKGQTATRPIVEITWDKHFKLSTLPNGCSEPKFVNPGYFLSCSIGEYLRNEKEKTLEIFFNMEDFYVSKPKDNFRISSAVFYTQNVNEKYSQDSTTTDLDLIADVRPRIFGSKLRRINFNSKFQHVYDVILEGPSPVERISLEFKIPVNKTVGGVQKQILAVVQEDADQYKCIVKKGSFAQIGTTTENPGGGQDNTPQTSTTESPQPDEDYPVPGSESEHEVEVDHAIGRQKRDTRSVGKNDFKKSDKFKVDANTLGFTCDGKDKSIECMEVECTTLNVSRGDVILITFEYTVVGETGYNLLQSLEKDTMLVESIGLARIESLGLRDEDTSQTLLETLQKKDVAVWVYIVAAIGGILVLVLLITILYKFGFFKRDTKKQLEEMKAQQDEVFTITRQSLLIGGEVPYNQFEDQTDELGDEQSPDLTLARKD